MSTKPHIVCFVCMSNTCRSPMAEYLLKHKISSISALNRSVEIRSRALTDAYEKPGSPASSQGVEVLRNDFGIDMSGHQSTLLTQRDLDEADFIIPVKRDLGSYIFETFNVTKEKVMYLRNDIPDPWHQPVEAYRRCANSINSMLDPVVERLLKRAEDL